MHVFFLLHVLSMQDIHYSFTKSNSLRFAASQNRSWSLSDDHTRCSTWQLQPFIIGSFSSLLTAWDRDACVVIDNDRNNTPHRPHTMPSSPSSSSSSTHYHYWFLFNYRPICRARLIPLRFDGHSTAYQRSLRSPGRTHHDLFISLFRSQLRLWCRSSSGRDVYSYCSWMRFERRSNCRTTQVELK